MLLGKCKIIFGQICFASPKIYTAVHLRSGAITTAQILVFVIRKLAVAISRIWSTSRKAENHH